MAVFWFGWGKKVKNALTKKQADGLYLPKSSETEINELKRLTTFKIYSLNRLYGDSSPSVLLGTYGDSADETKPFFIEFRKSINSTETIYNFVAFFSSNEDIIFLTENLKIIIQLVSKNNLNCISIVFIINGLNSNEKIGKFKVRYTPKTLTTN